MFYPCCRECGTVLDTNMRFCPQCGVCAMDVSAEESGNELPEPEICIKNKKRYPVLWIVFGVVIAIAAVILIFVCKSGESVNTDQSSTVETLAQKTDLEKADMIYSLYFYIDEKGRNLTFEDSVLLEEQKKDLFRMLDRMIMLAEQFYHTDEGRFFDSCESIRGYIEGIVIVPPAREDENMQQSMERAKIDSDSSINRKLMKIEFDLLKIYLEQTLPSTNIIPEENIVSE